MSDILKFIGKKVLFLGCHLDDVEFGCGALLKRLSKNDLTEIRIETLSRFNQNANNEIQLERDLNEAKCSMDILGYGDNSFFVDEIPGQRFDSYRQEIRELLLKIRKEFQPDCVFFPARNDLHQDHAVLTEEALRIFRDWNCIGYEVIRSTQNFHPNLFVEITNDELDSKVDAIMSYKSQLSQSAAYYFDETIIKAISLFRGAQANRRLVEAYEMYFIRI